MNIGFDLDNVFIDTPPLIPHALIERLYRKKTNGYLQYRIPAKTEQLIRKLSHIHILRSPIKNNMAFLRSINKDSHNLFLISSRFSFLKNQTHKLIKRHKLDEIFQKLNFNFNDEQPHIFKEKQLKELKLDKYIDDDLHLLKYLASKINTTKFYWLNNKLDRKISNNIRAITKLSDIFEY